MLAFDGRTSMHGHTTDEYCRVPCNQSAFTIHITRLSIGKFQIKTCMTYVNPTVPDDLRADVVDRDVRPIEMYAVLLV